jgi:hypothetical protein
MAMTQQQDQQQKANRRLALILLSLAVVFGCGFVAKVALLGF